MKQGRGGKRPGAGRSYSPGFRMWLVDRYATLKYEFHKAGERAPGERALAALHAEIHPDGEGNPEFTKQLLVRGRHEQIFRDELDVKRCRGEPLNDEELEYLAKHARNWQRYLKRRARRKARLISVTKDS